jgi:hypothetical protein
MHFKTCHQIAHSRVNKRQYPWIYTPWYGMQQPKGSLCLAIQVHRIDGCAECGIQWPSFGRARELQVPQKSNTTGPLDHTGNWFLCYLSLSNLVSLSEHSCVSHWRISSVCGPRVQNSFIHSIVCLTTGPQSLPKRVLHTVQSSAFAFNFQYTLVSLRLSSSCLHIHPRLLVTSTIPVQDYSL